MDLFDVPRRVPGAATRAELEDFIDGNAAFVVRNCMYETVRSAAVYGWRPLEDQEFRAGMERACWLAYPLGVVAIAEIVAGVVRPDIRPGGFSRVVASLEIACARLFDRHQPPETVDAGEWMDARTDAVRRLERLHGAPPSAVREVPKSISRDVFALMPVHQRLRGRDPWLVQNSLTASLVKVHDDFLKHADVAALAAELQA